MGFTILRTFSKRKKKKKEKKVNIYSYAIRGAIGGEVRVEKCDTFWGEINQNPNFDWLDSQFHYFIMETSSVAVNKLMMHLNVEFW